MRILVVTKDSKLLLDSNKEDEIIVDNSLVVEADEDSMVIVLKNDYKPEGDIKVENKDGEIVYFNNN